MLLVTGMNDIIIISVINLKHEIDLLFRKNGKDNSYTLHFMKIVGYIHSMLRLYVKSICRTYRYLHINLHTCQMNI